MGEAKRRGTYAERRANPKGKKSFKVSLDVADTSIITRQMRRRFGFPSLVLPSNG